MLCEYDSFFLLVSSVLLVVSSYDYAIIHTCGITYKELHEVPLQ
jgi:hypothetical protein